MTTLIRFWVKVFQHQEYLMEFMKNINKDLPDMMSYSRGIKVCISSCVYANHAGNIMKCS